MSGALEVENTELPAKVVGLQEQSEHSKLDLKLERQTKYATNQQQNGNSETMDKTSAAEPDDGLKKKRGAPAGHPGWFHPQPSEYD